MSSDSVQSLLDLLKPSAPGEDKKWYEMESKEGHRFLGEVLQLRMRRDILKFIGQGIRSTPIGIAYLKNFEDFTSETNRESK